jgi:hypothetical protein
MVIGPPVAVKSPICPFRTGKCMSTPASGTGDGMRVWKRRAERKTDDGVAPLALIVLVAVPLMNLLPRAAAAEAKELGIVRAVWKLVTLN